MQYVDDVVAAVVTNQDETCPCPSLEESAYVSLYNIY